MKTSHIATLALVCVLVFSSYVKADDHGKEIDQIVKDYGYPFETHKITTSDGYILKAFRIPHGRNQDSNEKRPALTNNL